MIDRSSVVLGSGVVSPAGSAVDDLWRTVLAADRTEAEVCTYEKTPEVPVLGCRAHGFDPSERLERHEIRRLDRTHQMAFWAADDALAEARLVAGGGPPPERCAVIVGIGFGSVGFQEAQVDAFTARGYRGISPLAIPVVMPNSVAAHLSLRFGYRGPAITVTSACASGAMAIGEALWLLRSGRADRVLAGGVDAGHVWGVAGPFTRMEAMSTRLDDPHASSRPFDTERDGFVLGEGAGFVVLERADDHRQSDRPRVVGYATNADAHHIVAPPERGEGAAACMKAALNDAGVDADAVGHVNAHGTSTLLNDQAEAYAIADVIGPRAAPVTSSKGVFGHLIGAAGAVEIVVTMETIRHNVVPPTANCHVVDPVIAELIDVTVEPTAPKTSVALTNSLGFGGHNATLVIR